MRVYVLPVVESDTARVSVLPVAGSELPAVFLGKVALDVVGLGLGPSCLRVDSEEALPVLLDERGEMSFTVPGVTPDGGPMEGAPVLEPIRAFGSRKVPGRWTEGVDACARAVRAFGSGHYLERWTYGGGASFGTVRAFGSGKAPGRWTDRGDIGYGTV